MHPSTEGRRKDVNLLEDYHVAEDLVDKVTGFIADAKHVTPNKPFLMYFCTGVMHALHRGRKEWAN